MPTFPEIDDMFTIAPRLFSRMIAAALRSPFQVPFRCTAITWSNCSSVILRIVASRVMPALLTMMSSAPNPSTAAPTNASTSSADVTSQRTADGDVVTAQLLGRDLGCLEIHVTEHDPCALGDEPLRDGETQSLGATGNDRGLTGQQRHTITVLLSSPERGHHRTSYFIYDRCPGGGPCRALTATAPPEKES